MFFRSKKGNGKDTQESSPAAERQTVANAKRPGSPRMPSVSAASPKGSRDGQTLRRRATSLPNRSNQRNCRSMPAASKHLAATMGELFGLMARSLATGPKLSDIRSLVVPAVRTGQYSLASAQSKSHGYTSPVAAVLWASVSDKVDKRLGVNLSAHPPCAPGMERRRQPLARRCDRRQPARRGDGEAPPAQGMERPTREGEGRRHPEAGGRPNIEAQSASKCSAGPGKVARARQTVSDSKRSGRPSAEPKALIAVVLASCHAAFFGIGLVSGVIDRSCSPARYS